jgi:cytochrome c peroxidase
LRSGGVNAATWQRAALLNALMFWDSRARSLESQARGPLTGETEMRGPSFDETSITPELVQRLTAIPEYVARFDAAFGSKTIDDTSIVRAIATFERTFVTVPSYQRWLAGEAAAISDAAKRGVAEFRDSGCSRCHSGPMLSDFSLHRFTQGGEAIRTPSLRNVVRTAPYMHDGRATTLDQVFGIYRRVDQRADPLFRDLRVRAPRHTHEMRCRTAGPSPSGRRSSLRPLERRARRRSTRASPSATPASG